MKIVSILHDITQLGYRVEFSDDFTGMLTVTYKGEGMDWSNHSHVGFPFCSRKELEEHLIRELQNFLSLITKEEE